MMLDARSLVSSPARAGLLAVALVGSACDRADDASAQATHCARFCEALERCDDGTDLADCEDHCEADEVRSDAYFRARADCGEKLSCNLWMTEVDNQGDPTCQGECNLSECVDDTLAKIEPSQEEEQVCSSIGTKINACDPTLETRSTMRGCVRTTPLLSPAYLAESKLCLERECAEINTCLGELADEYGTELRLFSGALTPR